MLQALHDVYGSWEPHINQERGFEPPYKAVPAIVRERH